MVVSSDALDLAGTDSADHVPYALSDGCLEHLVELAYVHAQIVHVLTLLIDIEHHRYMDLLIYLGGTDFLPRRRYCPK